MWLKAQNEMAGLWRPAAMGPVERLVSQHCCELGQRQPEVLHGLKPHTVASATGTDGGCGCFGRACVASRLRRRWRLSRSRPARPLAVPNFQFLVFLDPYEREDAQRSVVRGVLRRCAKRIQRTGTRALPKRRNSLSARSVSHEKTLGWWKWITGAG